MALEVDGSDGGAGRSPRSDSERRTCYGATHDAKAEMDVCLQA